MTHSSSLAISDYCEPDGFSGVGVEAGDGSGVGLFSGFLGVVEVVGFSGVGVEAGVGIGVTLGLGEGEAVELPDARRW